MGTRSKLIISVNTPALDIFYPCHVAGHTRILSTFSFISSSKFPPPISESLEPNSYHSAENVNRKRISDSDPSETLPYWH